MHVCLLHQITKSIRVILHLGQSTFVYMKRTNSFQISNQLVTQSVSNSNVVIVLAVTFKFASDVKFDLN